MSDNLHTISYGMTPGPQSYLDEIHNTNHKPFWKRPVTWIVSVIVLAAIGVALFFGLTALGTSGPESILHKDGYSNTAVLSGDQLKGLLASDNSSDAQMAKSMISSATVGTKGGNMEAVITLTDSGKSLIKIAAPFMGAGSTDGTSYRMDGEYLVISGPASSFNK